MDMAGNDTNIKPQDTPTMSSDWQINGNNLTNTSIGLIPTRNPTVEPSSCSSAPMVDNSFCAPMWDPQNLGYCDVNVQSDVNAMLKGNMFVPAMAMAPQSLPHFPADSGFIERAARFSCFSGGNLVEMMNPFGIHDNLNPYSRGGVGLIQGRDDVFGGNASRGVQSPRINEMNNDKRSESFIMRSPNDGKWEVGLSGNESDEAEFSGRGAQEECSSKGFGSKKRKRGAQGNEHNENNEAPQRSTEMAKDNVEIKQKGDQNPTSITKSGGKNVKQGSQGLDQPKEDYIHIRARRGQATNSHSLAERVRREKISERMKFLQDLVPGCSKVTGKAVMLDEIINYVQSLQRQVEFLSMKLATVNHPLAFNIEGLLAKDILQHQAGISSSMAFPTDMTMHFPPLRPSQPGLIQACLAANSSETLRRPINLQSSSVSGRFKEPTSQVSSVWDDELHNIVHMGFNTSAPLNSQDLSGSLPPSHMKAEP